MGETSTSVQIVGRSVNLAIGKPMYTKIFQITMEYYMDAFQIHENRNTFKI